MDGSSAPLALSPAPDAPIVSCARLPWARPVDQRPYVVNLLNFRQTFVAPQSPAQPSEQQKRRALRTRPLFIAVTLRQLLRDGRTGLARGAALAFIGTTLRVSA